MTNPEFLKLQLAAMRGIWFKNIVKEKYHLRREPTQAELAEAWRHTGYSQRFREHFQIYLDNTAYYIEVSKTNPFS